MLGAGRETPYAAREEAPATRPGDRHPMGRRTSRRATEDLRRAIDGLPLRTREAMLEGVRTNEIIVGAYADRLGGICPMLAAHRCGGRTSFISFARAWDRFAGARRARRASARELAILQDHLTASILAEGAAAAGAGSDAAGTLAGAIADHQATARARRAREARAAEQPAFPPTPAEWLRARRARRDRDGALERVERASDREPA